LSHVELIEVLKQLYGQQHFEVGLEMGLLAAFGFIGKDGDYYFRTLGDSRLFFSFQGLNVVRFRSDIVNSYFKNSRSRLDILKRNIG